MFMHVRKGFNENIKAKHLPKCFRRHISDFYISQKSQDLHGSPFYGCQDNCLFSGDYNNPYINNYVT